MDIGGMYRHDNLYDDYIHLSRKALPLAARFPTQTLMFQGHTDITALQFTVFSLISASLLKLDINI